MENLVVLPCFHGVFISTVQSVGGEDVLISIPQTLYNSLKNPFCCYFVMQSVTLHTASTATNVIYALVYRNST